MIGEMTMPTNQTLLRAAVLALALVPVACTGESSTSLATAGDDADPAAVVEAEIDSQDIISQDAADAAAEEAIDEENADDVLAELTQEIENDG